VALPQLVGLAVLGVAAGWLGALVGIGGGLVIVPALVLGFGLDVKTAVAASLVSVIATSTAAGSVYVGRGLANMRLGMTLEVATTIGGLLGGLAATAVPSSVLGGVFAGVMTLTALLMLRGSTEAEAAVDAAPGADSGWEEPGRLAGAYVDASRGGLVRYEARRLPLGAAVSLLAGSISGMLGVGGGFLKVPAMTLGMGVPVKVAAATSNFMIGVTAAASVFIYFRAGYLEPLVAAPVALGVTVGALAGTRTAHVVAPRTLERVLAVVLIGVAVQMGLDAAGLRLAG